MKKILMICLLTSTLTLFSNTKTDNQNKTVESVDLITNSNLTANSKNTNYTFNKVSVGWSATCYAKIMYKGEVVHIAHAVGFGDSKDAAIQNCKSMAMFFAYSYIQNSPLN